MGHPPTPQVPSFPLTCFPACPHLGPVTCAFPIHMWVGGYSASWGRSSAVEQVLHMCEVQLNHHHHHQNTEIGCDATPPSCGDQDPPKWLHRSAVCTLFSFHWSSTSHRLYEWTSYVYFFTRARPPGLDCRFGSSEQNALCRDATLWIYQWCMHLILSGGLWVS